MILLIERRNMYAMYIQRAAWPPKFTSLMTFWKPTPAGIMPMSVYSQQSATSHPTFTHLFASAPLLAISLILQIVVVGLYLDEQGVQGLLVDLFVHLFVQ